MCINIVDYIYTYKMMTRVSVPFIEGIIVAEEKAKHGTGSY
jgi:hypothetical protein